MHIRTVLLTPRVPVMCSLGIVVRAHDWGVASFCHRPLSVRFVVNTCFVEWRSRAALAGCDFQLLLRADQQSSTQERMGILGVCKTAAKYYSDGALTGYKNMRPAQLAVIRAEGESQRH